MTTVFTNGVFDVLHIGHINLLIQARLLGDKVVVGINSDRVIKKLKGKNRPVFSQVEREIMLKALVMVDEVIIFDDLTASDLLRQGNYDIYVKGYDYKDKDFPEKSVAEELGMKVIIANPLPKNTHTSDIIKEILQSRKEDVNHSCIKRLIKILF